MPVSLTIAVAYLADQIQTDEWPPRPLPSERTAVDMAVNPSHVERRRHQVWVVWS